MIPFFVVSIIVGLWVKGGQKKGRMRDVGCPIALGIGLTISLLGNDYWRMVVAGIATIVCSQIIRLGYGNYDPENDDRPSFLASITKDRQGAIIRLIWGALVGVVTPLALLFMHFIILPPYIAYIVTNSVVNYSVSKLRLPVFWADLCVANAFGSLLFYIAWR